MTSHPPDDDSPTDWPEELKKSLPGLRDYVAQRAGRALLREESVEDIVQSACREALVNARQLEARDGGVQSGGAWLYWHATRKIIERARQLQRDKLDPARRITIGDRSRAADPLADLYRTTMDPSKRAIQQEDLDLLEQAIQGLPDQYALVIRLAYFEGLPRKEIAELMGRPGSNAVQILLSRAIARLAVVMRSQAAD